MAYADVEIRIFKKENGRYPAEITVNSEREFPRGYLDAGGQPATPTSADYADDKYGEELFRWLFADKTLSNAWAEIRGAHPQRRVRLRIDADEPELHRAVWEALRDPCEGGIPLALATTDVTPFSRYLALPSLPGKPVFSRPIRILLVAPAQTNFRKEYPTDQYPDLVEIDPAAELASLTKALQPLIDRGAVLPPKPLPQPCSLARIMDELRNGNGGKGYHVLHLVCHGDFNLQQQRARLWLATEDNELAPATDQEFATRLHELLGDAGIQDEDRLRLVFLSSCESAKRSSADAFRGVAPQLVKAGVPAVVAMQDQVGDQTAREFAGAFYQQLLKEGQVDLAANVARAQITAKHLPGPVIPVLFLRLRNGQLFGQRGQILGDRAGSFWSTLLSNIAGGKCTPILGPGVTAGLLPTHADLAQDLAMEHNYPFADAHNLPRVAQFLGTEDKEVPRQEAIRKLVAAFKRGMKLRFDPAANECSLSETIESAKWPGCIDEEFESEIHQQLADLNLPLYVTTNFDNFMVLALKAKNRAARREAVNWQGKVSPGASHPHYDLKPPPSKDKPVVIHLFGTDDDPLSIVFTEDDYLDYLARISRDYEYLLPTTVQKALASTSLLFLGYRLEDMGLKVILRGLLPNLDLERWGKLHVSVQIESSVVNQPKQEEVTRYFQKYFSKSKIDVYWGSAQQFVAELHSQWQEYKHA